ncbi:MAG: UvrD-helicase domain-containing protein [Planctomyces sp.]|nr:UvrD-helicase domain-containing protein [Planctomyces sp.]
MEPPGCLLPDAARRYTRQYVRRERRTQRNRIGVGEGVNVLEDLTPAQREAVEHGEGPLLVLAGPGSGKTRVVTRRIARLIERGVSPRSILAITFTNKAAETMRSRVHQLVPGAPVWVSTFHRFSAMLLRRYAEVVGLRPNYSILDDSDQRRAIKQVLQDLDYDPAHYSPDRVAGRIGQLKGDLVTADQFSRQYEEGIGNNWDQVVAHVYPAYQRWLLESNAVDFDDLLLHVASLLSEHPELRRQLDHRYQFVLVDEYQDTNAAQYRIIAALSQEHPNIQATGDPDQSIYAWRGARIENILRFEREFPDCHVVKLEQNFRSTQAIVRSADRLIAHNRQRKAKRLVTDNAPGEDVELVCFDDASQEAAGIARRIHQLAGEQAIPWSEFAIVYRVNALSRQVEMALRRERIPYQVAAGAAFYDRAEIKDALAYLRLAANPFDRAAFARAVNTPLRGLGETSQRRLAQWADLERIGLLDACRRAGDVPKLSKNAARGFRAFAELIGRLDIAKSGSVGDLLTEIVDRSGLAAAWIHSPREEDQQRLGNVQELITAARQYDEAAGDERSIDGFLEQCALISDSDSVDDAAGSVTLMTLHSAKGLEFRVVFVLGVEEGLIPHERSLRDVSGFELEEERRLLFVGMTRAKERLFLTQTRIRTFRGRTLASIPSLFTTEAEVSRVDETALGVPDLYVQARDFERTSDDESADKKDDAVGAAKRADVPERPLLMTGAELLNGGKPSAAPNANRFDEGMLVRHPRYGLGTIVEVSRVSSRTNVTVRFAHEDRVQTFVAEKSPLQPVGVKNGAAADAVCE